MAQNLEPVGVPKHVVVGDGVASNRNEEFLSGGVLDADCAGRRSVQNDIQGIADFQGDVIGLDLGI